MRTDRSRRLAGRLISALLLFFALQNIYAIVRLSPLMANGAGDFKIFRTAAAIIASGHRQMLFDYPTQAAVQQQVYPDYPVGNNPLPYNHPSFEALLFLPLAPFSNTTAYLAWLACNVLLLVASLWLLAPALASLRELSLLPIAVIVLAFYPVGAALLHGQDSLLSLFLYALTFFYVQRGRDGAAGAVLALGLFKPQLVLPFVVLAFIGERRWRALRWFSIAGSGLVAVSTAVTGWNGAARFIDLGFLLQKYRPWLFKPRLMANIRRFTESLMPGAEVFRTALIVVASVAVLAFTFFHQRKIARPDLRFALQVTSTVLVSYHLYPYDLALMLIPLLLVANAGVTGGMRDQWLPLSAVGALLISPLHTWLVSDQRYAWMSLAAASLFVALSRSGALSPRDAAVVR